MSYKYPELNELSNVLYLEGEIWYPIRGFEKRFQVSNFGRVKRLSYKSKGKNQFGEFTRNFDEKIYKANKDSQGYPQVNLKYENKRRVARVHRLVCEAFLPEEEGKPYVNHKDGNPLNPNLDNLEWCTASYNLKHAYSLGIKKKLIGENNPCSVYNENIVKEVYLLAKNHTYSQKKIGEMFGMPQITVSNILLKRSWRDLTDKIDLEVH